MRRTTRYCRKKNANLIKRDISRSLLYGSIYALRLFRFQEIDKVVISTCNKLDTYANLTVNGQFAPINDGRYVRSYRVYFISKLIDI